MSELLIYTPDGKKQVVPLRSDRLTLGRSSAADLSFSEDNGLSRLHVAFEREGENWVARDLNSKNGTLVNGTKIKDFKRLVPNDKLGCGHLLIVFAPTRKSVSPVTFVEDGRDIETDPSTIVTSLGGVISDPAQGVGSSSAVAALIRAGNELASERPLPELFQFILDLATDAVAARRGVLLTKENGELVEGASKGEGFKISTTVRDRVLKGKLSVLVRDTTLDDDLRGQKSIIAQNVRTLIAVPLQAREQVIGLIYVDRPAVRKEFTRDDLNLLTVMANVAAIRIEHTRLAQVEQARILLARELEQAESIQRAALPESPPDVSGLDIAGHNAACRTVGGDYYDFFADSEGHVAAVVADVSGKGMPAALMMMAFQARTQTLFQTVPVVPGTLKRSMEQLNRITTVKCPEGRFITAFACVVDSNTGGVEWCCAGHNPPLIIRRDGSWETLRGGGPIIGLFPDEIYEQRHAVLAEGDLLAIYSDGISEASSPEGVEFDVPNLAAALVDNRQRGAKEIIDGVLDRVRAWTHGAPPEDDITLVIVRRTAQL